jgi:hypothetical protein
MEARLEAKIKAANEAQALKHETRINAMIQMFEQPITASMNAAETTKAKPNPPDTSPATPAPPTMCAPTISNNVINLRPSDGHVSTATSGPVTPAPLSSSGLTILAKLIVAATLKGKERMV